MKLTRDERKEILRGATRALRRPKRPKVTEGQVAILQWSRGGRQLLERREREIEKFIEAGKPLVVEMPREPLFWIVLREPRLKGDVWLIEFQAHDRREPVRLLAPPPSPPSNAGLKTRWRAPHAVPGREEHRETFTDESERGYGASARFATDQREAVDDEFLAEDRRRRDVDTSNETLRQAARLRAEVKRRPGKSVKAQLLRVEERLDAA